MKAPLLAITCLLATLAAAAQKPTGLSRNAVGLTQSVTALPENTIGLPLVINYTKLDFHGGTQTWAIAQSNSGVMYFANNEGLLSFDGTDWKTYPLPNRTIMRSIAIENDRIYAGGQGEMGYFTRDERGFLRYYSLVDLLPKDQNTFADVWDIKIYGGSVFFRATDRIFEYRNNSIGIYYPKTAWQFLTQAGDKLIAQDRKKGLLYFSRGQWIPYENSRLLDEEIVSGVTSINDDSLVITTERRGMYYLIKDTVRTTATRPDVEAMNTNIYRTAKLNDNQLVAATTSEGCVMMTMNGRIIQRISRTEGLQNNNVLCLFVDRDGNLWTGLNNGISMIGYNAAVKYIRPSPSNQLSGFSAKILGNNLYIGTSDGAYSTPFSPDSKDISFSKGHFTLIRNSDGQVWRLDEINRQLMMGHNGGTFVIRNGEAVAVSQDPSWLFVPISPVLPSQEILAGTYTGLKLLEYANNSFTDRGNLQGIYESFRFLAIENNGVIWASHPYRGVYQLQLSPDRRKYTARLFTDKDGLPSALNNQVFKINNRIVFATEKGVYEFNPVTNRFIPSPFLYSVFGQMDLRYLNEDAGGNIWFCSGKRLGVVRFNGDMTGKNPSIIYFPELTGQILSGFESIYPYDSENVFISSDNGIIHLNFSNYITARKNLTVLLGGVKILDNRDSIVFGGYKAQGNTENMHRHRSFHFEFSSPNYGFQNNIEYSYQLKGYDNDWSPWTPKTEKDYTNLPDGEYTFTVKARDNLGNESPGVTYSFLIEHPFYKSGWAWFIYCLLFLLIVYGLKKWQARSLGIQKRKYEQRQQQIIALHNLEIEKNEKEIIKLQNEKLANEVLLKKRELADASMHLVEREDALARVKDELQKLYKKTDNSHDVKTALQLLNGIEKNKSNWDQFASHFNEISNDSLKKLKTRFPGLTNSDLKVCAYLQLNLSSKEIAQLMNISVRGVEMSRYRIRKKIQIPPDQTLNAFLNTIP